MELHEMQATWSQMSQELEKQKTLTNELIMEMRHQRYQNKISVLSKYEGLGAIICFIGALLLLPQLQKMDTWYLMASGIFTVCYLVILPAAVLYSIYKLRTINVLKNSYRELLVAYAKRKKRFLQTQQVGIVLNFIFLAVSLPVVLKVFKDKDLFIDDSNILFWYVPIMAIFLIIFSRWGYGKYKNVVASANSILEELDGKKGS
ncbi:hypothetical protein [Flagellimonas lutaonensis]|uniref:Uncharacterized protein n=1 Tax=Flagellimonas lutaonensis TaxID=516051 RepID=A0A0D5YU36_9FLAO|nr:hypothetical protein [Allomuricauda lutaonensis]AKA35373.1 hypothetical protein VC82_1763 [Allomuricauda lutaonensis]